MQEARMHLPQLLHPLSAQLVNCQQLGSLRSFLPRYFSSSTLGLQKLAGGFALFGGAEVLFDPRVDRGAGHRAGSSKRRIECLGVWRGEGEGQHSEIMHMRICCTLAQEIGR